MTERTAKEFSQAFHALLLLCDPWLFARDDVLRSRLHGLGRVDAIDVLGLARRHRVAPLLAKRIEALGWETLPGFDNAQECREALAKETRIVTVSELAMLAELRALKILFDSEEIRFVLIKGLSLSQRCFGQLGWRINRDIDILIAPEDLPRAHAVLKAVGYQRVDPADDLDPQSLARQVRRSKDWVYVLKSKGVVLELHHRLFDNDALCVPGIMDRARPLNIVGQLELLTLAPEDDLPYLALHGAMHAWSRLKWLVDLAILIRDRPSGDLAAMIDRERGTAAFCALHQAISLCWELFSPPDAQPVQGRPWRAGPLTSTALAALSRHGSIELEDTRFGTTLKNMSHYLLWANFSYLRTELIYDLTDTSREKGERRRYLPIWLSRSIAWIGRHR